MSESYWAAHGQVSNFTLRNTVPSSRTLVKCHKDLKGTEGFARSCFRKKLIWKVSQKITTKETIMKSFFQLRHNLQRHWKRTQSQLFSDDFWKDFQNTVLYRNIGKGTEGTENSPEYILEKRWSESFTKFIRKKLRRSPFLVKWQLATLLKNNFVTVIFLWL